MENWRNSDENVILMGGGWLIMKTGKGSYAAHDNLKCALLGHSTVNNAYNFLINLMVPDGHMRWQLISSYRTRRI